MIASTKKKKCLCTCLKISANAYASLGRRKCNQQTVPMQAKHFAGACDLENKNEMVTNRDNNMKTNKF